MVFTPRTIAAAVDKVARDAVGKDWSLYATLLDHWREIVGDDYAEKTTPVKLTFSRGKKSGGTLHIRLPQGLSMSFSFHQPVILGRINGFFGHNAVQKLVLEPYYPSSAPKEPESMPILSDSEQTTLKQAVKTIENEELKAILQQLGESILTQNKSP